MTRRKATSGKQSRVPVVGVGASAGGIAALQSFFRALPSNPRLAFVVIQHLAPGRPSHLVDLVANWTQMTVRRAVDGDRPEPGCVYVSSADHVLTLERGVFRTTPEEGRSSRPCIDTIDTFFESLARDRGAKATGVILSGTGNDGSAGAICIRRAGGIVLVQDPVTAMHDDMPRAIIEHGSADYILPVGKLAEQIVRCASPSYVRPQGPISGADEMARALDEIVDLVRRQAGFDLGGYKATPLIWRVQQRMDTRRVRSFEDYAVLLRDDPAELEALIARIPLHVTQFFRDPEAWDALNHEVIGHLVNERTEADPIRAWTPACATGEEAYSVAMLLSEHTLLAGRPMEFKVFATDASPDVIARASRGVYPEHALELVDAERRSRFFYAVDGACRVKRSLRERMVFARQDLLSDPPFPSLDLITCRNLLIYLQPDAIRRVLSVLHSALRLGGYLFLGKGESLSPRQEGFEAVSTRWRVYRKVGAASDLRINVPSRLRGAHHATVVPAVAHRTAIENCDYPSVLTDGEFQVLRFYGETDTVLRLPAGSPTNNLLDLVQPELVPMLKDALKKAIESRSSVTSSGLLDRPSGTHSLSVRMTPLQPDEPGSSPRLLVSFIRAPEGTGRKRKGASRRRTRSSEPPAADQWRESVRASQEELDASREELEALNEELRTSNEQLNAVNEDLNDANEQLEGKIAELQMQSRVLSSGAVMTLFLDSELRVRWFTPAVNELFPLMPADVGRRITDFVRKFDDGAFVADVRSVMLNGEQSEAEVRTIADQWFLRRIRPHMSPEETNAGVAVTFIDITDRKRAEGALLEREAWLAGQQEALEAALNGQPLEVSLGALVRTAIARLGEGVRAAFYLSNAEATELHHVVGMSAAYAEAVDGFKIGSDSLACGLATHSGTPVLTTDVMQDPRWAPWRYVAEKFDYRGCWSFPIHSVAGSFVGTFAVYSREPRAATARDVKFAGLVTQSAAIIIAQHIDAELCRSAEEALREREAGARAVGVPPVPAPPQLRRSTSR